MHAMFINVMPDYSARNVHASIELFINIMDIA